MSEDYDGELKQESYVYDHLIQRPLERKVELKYKRTQLLDLFTNKDDRFASNDSPRFSNVLDATNRVTQIAYRRKAEKNRKRLVNSIMRNALGVNYDENMPLTEFHLTNIRNEFMKVIIPYVARPPLIDDAD